jgi:uncharacterized tellurite resistance protein B-like protein
MAQGLLSRIRMLFEGDANIRKVADDPVLSAELVLLFRMILADGEVSADEMGVLRRICAEAFGINEEGLDAIVSYLSEYGYETTSANALALFRDLDPDRRKELARHMADIAKADHQLAGDEMRLLRRTLEVLSLDAGDLVAGR